MQQDVKYFIIGQLVEQNTLMGMELQRIRAAVEQKSKEEAEKKAAEEDPVVEQMRKNRPAEG